MILHLLGLQQRKLKAEGEALVMVVDFEPPTWFRSHHLTYAESLALLDTLLGFGHTVPALKELSSPGGSENQPVANCLSLLLWLSLWGNSH